LSLFAVASKRTNNFMLQRTAMMALGYFVFMRSTLPYQSTSREMSWKHPQNSVVGAMPRSQFTGK